MSQGSDPVINSNGSFTFPAWFAHRLLSCYYGNGPRADGASSSTSSIPAETVASGHTPPTQSTSLEGEFAGGVVLDIGGLPRGYKPQGFAARQQLKKPHDSLTVPPAGGGVTSNGH